MDYIALSLTALVLAAIICILVLMIDAGYRLNGEKYYYRRFRKLLEKYPIEPDKTKQKKKISISYANYVANNNARQIVKAMQKEIE